MKYQRNTKLVYLITVASNLSFASALLVPFFTQGGLDQSQILWLQSIFSVAVVLLEVPTGYIADTYARALSLRLGSIMIGLGFLSYALMHGFLQYVFAEVILAIGVALTSGANAALVYDSIAADGLPDENFRKFQARSQGFGFAVVALTAPIGSLLASHVGIRPVIFLDGIIALAGFVAGLFLKEPPKLIRPKQKMLPSIRAVFTYCIKGHEQVPLLLVLGSAMSAATYFGYWLAPAYYTSVGIPLAWFGVILAVRSALKWALSFSQHRIDNRYSDRIQLTLYVVLSFVPYLVLAAVRLPVGIFALAAFDVVQSLQGPLVSHKLNQLTPSHIRAQVMSVANLSSRGMYAVLGPVFGLAVDHSIRLGMLLCAAAFAPLCIWPLVRLGRSLSRTV
jgi:MFS family permease